MEQQRKGLEQWQKDYILSHYRGKGPKKMAEEIGAPYAKVNAFYSNHGLDSGETGRFEKGNVSYNKGKKWDEFMSPEGQARSRKTCFAKRHRPHNWKPIGSVRYDSKSKAYLIKTSEGQRNNYVVLSRVRFEQEKGRKPEAGELVLHLNGDPSDFSAGNLKEVTRAENAMMNSKGLAGTGEKGLIVARLYLATGDARRRLKTMKGGRKDAEEHDK